METAIANLKTYVAAWAATARQEMKPVASSQYDDAQQAGLSINALRSAQASLDKAIQAQGALDALLAVQDGQALETGDFPAQWYA